MIIRDSHRLGCFGCTHSKTMCTVLVHIQTYLLQRVLSRASAEQLQVSVMNKDGHLTIKHGVSAVTGYFLSDFQIEEVLCLYRRLDCMFTLLSIVGRQQSQSSWKHERTGFLFYSHICMHACEFYWFHCLQLSSPKIFKLPPN